MATEDTTNRDMLLYQEETLDAINGLRKDMKGMFGDPKVMQKIMTTLQNHRGEDGVDGVSVESVVSEKAGRDIVLRFNMSDGNIIEERLKDIQGLDGKDGHDGIDGRDGSDGLNSTITIGKVEDGDEVSVKNVGTSSNIVLDFVIPKAVDGVNGSDGKDGRDGKSFIYRGSFDINKDYKEGDVVESEGSSYVATKEISRNGLFPTQNSDSWGLLALKGRDGFSRGGGSASSGGSGAITSLSPGDSITITGNGTSGDPYVISAPDVSNKITKVPLTDNALIRANGTSGDVQDSLVTVDDDGGTMTPGGIGVGISAPTSGINSEGNVDLTNSSASNAVGRVINFRTSTVIRASIAGFRDSTASGGNIRFNTSLAGGAPVEAMRILSNKFVGMNTSTPDAQLQVNGDINWSSAGNIAATNYITVLQASSTAVKVNTQILGTGAADSSMINGRFTANGNGPANIMYKSRGGSIGSMTTVVNNDIIGNYTFVGADGTTNGVEVARIRSRVDGATGTGNVPGALEFFTNPGSTDQATIGMSLHSDNSLAIGYGTTQQSTMLAVNGTGFFNGNVAASTPTLAPHLTTKAYVDSADALKADDSSVVHLTGAETVTGLKTFSDVILASNASPTYAAGKLVYDTANDELTFFNSNANVSLQVGAEQRIKVMNSTGADIPNGSAVYINGAASGLPTVALSRTNALATSQLIGLTTQIITNGGTGYVTTAGYVRDLNTSAFTVGAAVFVSSTTAGALTSTSVTSSTNNVVRVGYVVTSDTTAGIIAVAPVTLPVYSAQSATVDLGVILSNAGLRLAGTAYPMTTSGAVTLSGAASLTGSQVRTRAQVTATATVAVGTFIHEVNAAGATNQTLPTATAGKLLVIKNIGAGTVSLIGTIDGSTTMTLLQNKALQLYGNGTSWNIMGAY